MAAGSGQHPHYPGLFSAQLNGGWDNYISFRTYNGGVSLIMEDSDGKLVPSANFTSPGSFTDRWWHIAIAVDNSSYVTFYVNGAIQGTSIQSLSQVNLNYLNRGYAGSLHDGGQQAHYDEIKLIAKELSGSEVLEHFSRENHVRLHYGWP